MKKKTRAPGGGRKKLPDGQGRVALSTRIAADTMAHLTHLSELGSTPEKVMPIGQVIDAIVREKSNAKIN